MAGKTATALSEPSVTAVLGKCQQTEREEREERWGREAPACWATFNYFGSHQTENCPPWQISPTQRACTQPRVATRTYAHEAPFIHTKSLHNSKHHQSQATGRSILCTSTHPHAVQGFPGLEQQGASVWQCVQQHYTTLWARGRLGGTIASLDGSQNISTSEVGLVSPHGSSCLSQPPEADIDIFSLFFSLEAFSGACGCTSALQVLFMTVFCTGNKVLS